MDVSAAASFRTESLSRDYERSRYAVPQHILRSEVIYGEGFQSPGGLEGFKETVVREMSISRGMRLLDIGSGLGGAAFFLTSSFGVEVVGVDVSDVMISIASDRKPESDAHDRVKFILGDIYSRELEEKSFDLIYSRDSLLYEANKERLFRRCLALLKPGHVICVSDFCRGKTSPEFEKYVDISGYDLPRIDEYSALLSRAGFTSVVGKDLSEKTRGYLQRDLDKYRAQTEERDVAVSEEDRNHVIERWLRKIVFMEGGCLVQGLFVARKPA